MKNTIILLSIFCVFATISFSQNTQFTNDDDYTSYYLGFRIIPTYTGVGQYVIVYAPYGKIEGVSTISKEEFIENALGLTKSEVNPSKKNLFDYYGIKNYYIVNNIWRLRYGTYPMRTHRRDSVGWSANKENLFVPSEKQLTYLQKYGISSIYDICYGKNCFRLLRDMENQSWVNNYRTEKF